MFFFASLLFSSSVEQNIDVVPYSKAILLVGLLLTFILLVFDIFVDRKHYCKDPLDSFAHVCN